MCFLAYYFADVVYYCLEYPEAVIQCRMSVIVNFTNLTAWIICDLFMF